MTDTSQAAEQPPQTNGISDLDDEEKSKMRPVDIDADVREMERRKRVEMIMNSKLFREELERILDSQLKDGSGPSGLLQQISDMVGVNRQGGNVFKSSSCVIPVNDIRGIEAMGYAKGEKILRCKLACLYRLIDLYGWASGSSTLITARLNQDDEQFLVNPYGMLFHEVTASSLIKVDMQGSVIEQGTTNFSVNITAYSLHAAVHSARPDIKCIIHVHTPAVVAVSSLKQGLIPLSQESVVIGEISTHVYLGGLLDPEEKDKLARNLGPINKVLLLTNQGALCCGETIEEAFFNARNTVLASESQLKLLPIGIDNLFLINDEIRKRIYEAAHKAPESTPRPDQPSILEGKVERKWRVGGIEFEALMRMLDNAGFRTGYIYRHPLVKGEPPKPKNDVEVPPAVSSLGYLLEEEELYRQGLWRKLEGGRKGHDRSRWLNSPNTYQKVEILETGTPDPKKITKWVAEMSPSHSSTPVRIESALQFVPKGTNPKEFKQKQQQIKDYRRADKISAGPQSHILEGVTWEEAKKMQDATVTQTGDHVVLMGAASKGIIQRGHQHNAMVYKSPYAKNPFDCVTDEELNEYKKVVEKKAKGEYDTDYSESEGLSSAAMNKRIEELHIRSPTSVTSETEEESRDEPQILRIETKTAPKPSQPEVVLSDVETETSPVETFLKAERVSMNNYRGYQYGGPPLYRTNNHAGLPKGSYLDPNPVHFHIVKEHQIAIRHRPIIISTNKTSNQQNSSITINLGNSNSISLNMPLDTLRGFIIPFATALNLRCIPLYNDQESQTTYLNEVSYTPLYVSRFRTCQTYPDETASFEQRILDNMQQQMLLDDSDISETDLESSLTSKISLEKDINQFNENDQVTNESLVEITPEIAELLSSYNDEFVSSTFIREFVDKIQQITDAHSELAEGVLKDMFDKLSKNHFPVSSSLDEGIEDCTLTNRTSEDDVSAATTVTVKEASVEKVVDNLTDLVVEYLIQQCLEVEELVIFPELLHDPNLDKLLTKMLTIFNEFYKDDVEKNVLRVNLASSVLKKLEVEEKLNNSNDSLVSNTISDKIFTISEFLNDILDRFFDTVEKGEQFLDFTKPLVEEDGEILHSTPELPRKVYDEIEVTTFQKKTLTKSGSELFWMTISPRATKKETSPPKIIINVDDIPLKPPQDLILTNSDRILSPIPEETRLNLFDSCLSDDVEDFAKDVENSYVSFEDEDVASLLSNDSDGKLTPIQEGCLTFDVEKDVEGGYVNVENEEVTTILSNKVNFYRTQTVNTSAYVNVKTAAVKRVSDNKENEPLNNSGDWMGYEEAKF